MKKLRKIAMLLFVAVVLNGCNVEVRPNVPGCNDPGYTAQSCR